ncbi:PaaI family thioesterase [Limibacillus sp. MBR-115]|jgi:uncharacterized protein (TIGR00369 family)|uniref:PaaI family thioesterase n=1 Tax=Limibacillus sp. MBR-115 TaxID=3156465 RepID=UPI0033920D0B
MMPTAFLDRLEKAYAEDAWQALVDSIPYAAYLGLVVDDSHDEMRLRMPFREDLVGNPTLSALHGGVIGAFLETTAMMSLLWKLKSPLLPKTVTVTVDYLRSSRREDIFAAGEVTKLGRRVASVRVVAWSRNRQRPIGETRTHFLVAEGGKP